MPRRAALPVVAAIVVALSLAAIAAANADADDEKLLAEARHLLDGDGPPVNAHPPDAMDDSNDSVNNRNNEDDSENNNDRINERNNDNNDAGGEDRQPVAAPDIAPPPDPPAPHHHRHQRHKRDQPDPDSESEQGNEREDVPPAEGLAGLLRNPLLKGGINEDTASRLSALLARAARKRRHKGRATHARHRVHHSAPSPTPTSSPGAEADALRHTLAGVREDLGKARLALERERKAFQRALHAAKQEHGGQLQEMRTTIDEQRRAFDELFEEKRIVSRVLSDEQKTLRELQEKVQHPDLGVWIRQRAQRAAVMVETPETGAMKFYARKFMAPKVDKMRHRIELLERNVERTVDHLLPAKYGYFVAILLSLGLVCFPVVVSVWTMLSWSKQMSLRQYVLVGNVFLTAFATALCGAGVLLRQDPLQTLYEAGEMLFISLQLVCALAFPPFLLVLLGAVWRARDRLDMFVFGCEFVFYVLVGLNYRARVWRPAMLGQNIETSAMMYFVYLMDFVSMTALTVSSARMDPAVMQTWKEVESGMLDTYHAATAAAASAAARAQGGVGRSASAAAGRPLSTASRSSSSGGGLGRIAGGILRKSMSGDAMKSE